MHAILGRSNPTKGKKAGWVLPVHMTGMEKKSMLQEIPEVKEKAAGHAYLRCRDKNGFFDASRKNLETGPLASETD